MKEAGAEPIYVTTFKFRTNIPNFGLDITLIMGIRAVHF
jgi:hypothetical protein